MDLYFKTVALMLFGIIFAFLIYLVSNSIGLAQLIKDTLVKPTDINSFDTITTSSSFLVDINSFVVFVLGQQHLHSILLMDAREYYIGKVNRVRVDFNIEDELNTGDKILNEIRVVPLTEDLEVERTWNAVDVSGNTGLMINTVKDFKTYVLTKNIKTIEVTKYTLNNGSIYLVCEPNN